MPDKKQAILFPTFNISAGMAIEIVKFKLNDDTIPIPTKVLAIDRVAQMETHNSISKDDLVASLRWLFEHYEF